MADHDDSNGWDEYKRLVLAQLEEHGKEIERLRIAIHEMRKAVNDVSLDIARLNIKASVWGALAGVVTAAAAVLVQRL